MKKRLAIFGVTPRFCAGGVRAAAPEYGTEQTQEQEQIVLHLFHISGRGGGGLWPRDRRV